MSGKSRAKDPVLSLAPTDPSDPQQAADPATPKREATASTLGSARKRLGSDKAPAPSPLKKAKDDAGMPVLPPMPKLPAPTSPEKKKASPEKKQASPEKKQALLEKQASPEKKQALLEKQASPEKKQASPEKKQAVPEPKQAVPEPKQAAKAGEEPAPKKGKAPLPTASPKPFEEYAYPPEIVAVKDLREPKRKWPKNQLNFKCWPIWQENERDECVRDVLIDRGWRDCDAPCDPSDYDQLEPTLARKKGMPKKYMPPSRCLYVAGDDSEARKMLKNLGNTTNYCITGFPGGEPACFKTYTCKALDGKPYVPKTFLVPQQKNELLAHAATLPGSYWVGKPKNDYGGKKLCVTRGAEPLAGFGDGSGKQGVVQQYISDPLLVGPHKFHMRVYLLITALKGPRAYVHNDLTVMFATMPFTLDQATLGPGAAFEPRVHLSNYDINARPSNGELFFKDKTGVGEGCMWGAKRLEDWLMSTGRKELDPQRMWRQIHILCRDVAQSIAAHRTIKSFEHEEGMCHELYGLDVMMDHDGKVWLLECNNSPGLEYCGSHFTEGEFKGMKNPDAAENDAVTWRVIDDRMALLGFDYSDSGNEANYVRVC